MIASTVNGAGGGGIAFQWKRLLRRTALGMAVIAVTAMAGGLPGLHSAAAGSKNAANPDQNGNQPNSMYQIQPDAERIDVKVTLHKTETIRVATPFTEALVGNAEVADVVPLTDRTIYIVGKKVGVTRLSLLDKGKQLLGVIDVEVTYDLAGLRKRLAHSPGSGGIKVDSVNGKILLTGIAVDAPAMQGAMQLAEQLAPATDITNAMKVAAPQQVQLEVRFIEADRSATRALGINTTITGSKAAGYTGTRGDTSKGIVSSLVDNAVGTFANNATPFGSMIGRVLAGGTTADIFIKALEERGLARKLAEPNLVALSGDTASFLAGGEFPFPSGKDNNGQVTLEFKKFGIGLAFTPTVLSEGQINLKIEPEVSELDYTNGLTSNGFTVPGITVRRAATTVELRDGQSFAIAGLLQSRNIKNQEQLPWLGDVPVLGALLRSSSWEKNETDLVIIVTPHLVKPRAPGQKLATPLDKSLPSNDPEQFLLGKQEIERGQPDPQSGHILEWKDEAPVGGGYKEIKK